MNKDEIKKYLEWMVKKKLLRVENGAYIDSYELSEMIAEGMTRNEIYEILTGTPFSKSGAEARR